MAKSLYVKGANGHQEFTVVDETQDAYVINRFGHQTLVSKRTMLSDVTGDRIWSFKLDMASQAIESLEELIQSIKSKQNSESGQRDIAVICSRLKEAGVV